MYQQQPQMPQQNRSNNSVLITIIICATVIVLFILGFLLVKTLSDKDNADNKQAEQAAVTEVVADSAVSPTSYNRVNTLDVPEGDVKPARKRTGSLSNVGFTDDYSDIVCYTYLSGSDLSGLSKSQLRILRNTIYARHGRKFKSKDLQRYFSGFSWYTPRYDEISPSSLSDVEKHNISLIQKYE